MNIIEAYETRLKEEQVAGTYQWFDKLFLERVSQYGWETMKPFREYILDKVENSKEKRTRRQETIQYIVASKFTSIIDPPKLNLATDTLDAEEVQEVIAFFQLEKPQVRYKEIKTQINGPESFMTRIPYRVIYELYKRKIVPFDRQIFVGCLVRYNVWHGAKYNKELPKQAKDKLLTIFPTDEFSLDILMAVFEMELGVNTAFYLNSDFNIGGVIIALTEMGVLDRKAIHLNIFEAFNNPSLKQTTHGWVKNIHKDLEFTVEELLEHQDKYHNLLHNDRNVLASYGLHILKKISKNAAFNWESLSNNLEGIVYREKFNSGFKIALDLLQKQLKKEDSLLQQTCINLAPIFLQPEHKIQLKAKTIYEMSAPSEEIKTALTPYVDTMQAEVKKDLAAFIEGVEQEDNSILTYQQETYIPVPLSEIEKLTYIQTEEDFIFLTSKVLKSQDALDFELFLEGILRFQYLNKSKIKALSPALKQATKLIAHEYLDLNAKRGAHHYMIAKLICIWLDPKVTTFEQDKIKWEKELTKKHIYTPTQALIFMKMMSRITYIASLFSSPEKLPLLSTPTHRNGQIHPSIFFERLAAYNKLKIAPNEGDFNTAMCRLNRWTTFKNKSALGKENKEYQAIINYLLDSKQSFDSKQIKELENVWLTAFAIKNPEKAIDAIVAYQDEKAWWQAADNTSWQVGRRYSGDPGGYSWPTFEFETKLTLDDCNPEMKRDCYFGNHIVFYYGRIADISHWFHRDLHLTEFLYLNHCQRQFSYLTDLESEDVKQIMATINHAVQHLQPLGKVGHLFLSLSLFCGDRAIRSGAFDWLSQLVEAKILNLEWLLNNVKTILVNAHHPIPLVRAIEQFNELKQLGGEYLFILKCILVEVLENIDTTNLPKGFSKVLNQYYDVIEMTDVEITEAIEIKLQEMILISSVKKEAKKVLGTQ